MDKPTGDGKKPDFMIGVEAKKKKVYFFFVEVKHPNTSSKYQPEDDFIKLMKLMKASIDEQLTFGLLIEGFKRTLFKMTSTSDGVYMSIIFERFSLSEEIHQLVFLPSALDAFCFVKSELELFKRRMMQKKTRSEKEEAKDRIHPSFVSKLALF
ncbi:hypothetical protein EDC96DRAFT_514711 [Choanephora cucurbitarum]|nr:hypothetical protein EDC96DRAFT_514711 [Choanephora cucurbitarum]